MTAPLPELWARQPAVESRTLDLGAATTPAPEAGYSVTLSAGGVITATVPTGATDNTAILAGARVYVPIICTDGTPAEADRYPSGAIRVEYLSGLRTGITTGAQSITVAAAGKTFTRGAGSYVTDGFVAGDIIRTSGFVGAGNNGTFTATTVSALVITCSGAAGLVDEAAGGNEIIVSGNTGVRVWAGVVDGTTMATAAGGGAGLLEDGAATSMVANAWTLNGAGTYAETAGAAAAHDEMIGQWHYGSTTDLRHGNVGYITLLDNVWVQGGSRAGAGAQDGGALFWFIGFGLENLADVGGTVQVRVSAIAAHSRP